MLNNPCNDSVRHYGYCKQFCLHIFSFVKYYDYKRATTFILRDGEGVVLSITYYTMTRFRKGNAICDIMFYNTHKYLQVK